MKCTRHLRNAGLETKRETVICPTLGTFLSFPYYEVLCSVFCGPPWTTITSMPCTCHVQSFLSPLDLAAFPRPSVSSLNHNSGFFEESLEKHISLFCEMPLLHSPEQLPCMWMVHLLYRNFTPLYSSCPWKESDTLVSSFRETDTVSLN